MPLRHRSRDLGLAEGLAHPVVTEYLTGAWVTRGRWLGSCLGISSFPAAKTPWWSPGFWHLLAPPASSNPSVTGGSALDLLAPLS